MASKQTDREEAKDIIVQNGASSFVKARADWLNIDKVHLSFVQHSGLKNGCKKLAAIEAALPIYRATGKMVNNMPEDNVSGLQKLAYMVSNGSLFTRLKNSRSAALEKYRKENPNGAANGDIYCDSVFEFVGGSEAKSKNGNNIPIRYRKISIAPAAFKANRQNSISYWRPSNAMVRPQTPPGLFLRKDARTKFRFVSDSSRQNLLFSFRLS